MNSNFVGVADPVTPLKHAAPRVLCYQFWSLYAKPYRLA